MVACVSWNTAMRPCPIGSRAGIPGRAWLAGLAIGIALAADPAGAVLLDKDPDADGGMLCEAVETAAYRLRLTMSGHAMILLDESTECPVLPVPVFSVPGRGIVTINSDLGHGRGAWETVRYRREDTPAGARLVIRGRLLGLAVEQTLQAGPGAIEAVCRIRREGTVPPMAFCAFGPARFVRHPGGLPFSAETRDARRVTGDLGQPFEPVAPLQRLEVRVAGRRLVYDFGETEGVELRSSGTPPEHPTAAQIAIRAVNSPFAQDGAEIGYRWTITLTPDR